LGLGLFRLVVIELLCGLLSAWVASQKNRDSSEGFLLGALFGPLGVLVEGLLPTQPAPVKMERTDVKLVDILGTILFLAFAVILVIVV
jgi:hypothetical protein